MAIAEPWQKAEIPGPKRAMVVTKPEVIAAMARRAKHPILIVGHLAAETSLERKKLIDYLIQFAEKGRIPVVATAQTVKEFLKRKFKPAGSMPAVDIGNRLADPKWMGIDGKGPHDLAFLLGFRTIWNGQSSQALSIMLSTSKRSLWIIFIILTPVGLSQTSPRKTWPKTSKS